MLYAYLHFFGGISAPHTSATDQGTDWRNNDPQVEPFVEIYQGDRQDYEMPGAPRANTADDSISGFEAAGYVSERCSARAISWIRGVERPHLHAHFIHQHLGDHAHPRGILDAMKKRRMYGSTDNILADFRSGTHFMGESFTTTSPPVFTVRLWGTAPFQNVVVVKDDNVVYSTSGDRVLSSPSRTRPRRRARPATTTCAVLQTDGQIVWVSPMWVTMQ